MQAAIRFVTLAVSFNLAPRLTKSREAVLLWLGTVLTMALPMSALPDYAVDGGSTFLLMDAN